MIKIYHNTRCKKSRAGLEYLKNINHKFEIIEYLKDPLSFDELNSIIIKTGLKPFELIRTQEEIYKKQYKSKKLTDDEWIEAIVKNPKLLKRPIVEKNKRAVFADPPENIDNLFR